MRVHHLQIAAFGPFAARQDIDFDELSAAGLFLLNGETGAGKTSILDAICYALYAGLPGAREGTKSLRSDHAGPADEPEVVLEFSTGGRRFEVRRSPAWQRPSKRGTGKTTTAQAQSRLRELVEGQWKEISTRNDEVSAELRGVIGLGKDEFTRVAMLPQGAFAAFLRAKDKEREELLKKLFDTGLYDSVEALLAEELATARTAAEEADRARSEAVDQLIEDATASLSNDDGVSPFAADTVDGEESTAPDMTPEELSSKELLTLLETRLQESTARLSTERTAADAAAAQARTAASELAAAAERHRALAELDRLRATHAESGERMAAVAARVSLDEQAAALQPSDKARRRATQAVQDADQALESVREAAGRGLAADYLAAAAEPGVLTETDAATDDGPAETEAAELSQRAAEAASRVTGDAAVLEAALPEERELSEHNTELDKSQADLELRRTAQAEKLREQEALGDSLPRLREAAEALSGTAGTLPTLTATRDDAAHRVAAVAARQAAEAAATQAHTVWAQAKDEQLAARERLLDLGRTRLAQAAAALARELVPGQACLVCGSAEHPAPAKVADGELVEEEDEESARQLAAAADAAETEAASRLHAAREAASRAAGQAGESTAEQADQALADANQALAEATESAAQAQRARTAVEEATEKFERLRMNNTAEATALTVLAGSIEQLGTRITTLESRLKRLRGEEESLRSRHELLVGARGLLEELARAAGALDSARRAADTATATWETERHAAGFHDDAAWAAALLDPEARAGAQAQIAEHTAEGVRIDTLAGTEAVARAKTEVEAGFSVPGQEELAEAQAAATETATARDTVLERDAVLRSYASRFGRRSERLRELETSQGAVLERYARVKSMADIARGLGENRFKMTLSTYVLAARLEAVAAAATERLLVMSAERYSLVHDDSPKGNAKSGLGLHVLDAWTGQRRDTQTLSGGESFMASLALALGLADVIQQQSGGIDIETLFVDEGFGSLDEGALETVMDALDGLRRGGRVVGLVSHVAEMKQRIPAQLRVRKERTGSTTEVVLADTVE
ncbi:AAA family ATPase [Arthrobacter rhombi]|uniref:AAA family ATPase n=1 Tax=Arthrobacter rhombi TaxID=71253 RepID=UPI003FCF8F25